ARDEQAHRGAAPGASAQRGAQPALGPRAHDRDPLGAARHLVAALQLARGWRAQARGHRGGAARGAGAGAPGPHQDAADGALRGDRDRTSGRAGRRGGAECPIRLTWWRPCCSRPTPRSRRCASARCSTGAVGGVMSEATLGTVLERRLLRIAGRKEARGRPFVYETTRELLVAFGLRDPGDLAKIEGELVIPELAAEAATADGEAQAQQDPGAGGAQQPAGS